MLSAIRMTTTYSTQTYTIPRDDQVPLYGNGQQLSPASSTSPTSPRVADYASNYTANPAKQLRPLKSPLYVPAVLRPTEHFPTTSPMTPPKSVHGSLDSVAEEHGTQPTITDLDLYLEHGQAGEVPLSEVTGPPTKEHWKPDDASPNCDSPQCRNNFNLFTRKHHCRHCGHIFCSTHVNQSIPLDQDAKFHPEGFQSRACETCHRQYHRWDTARSICRKDSNGSDDSTSQSTSIGMGGPPGHRRMISNSSRSGQPQPPQPSIANSVPKDWAWSTF